MLRAVGSEKDLFRSPSEKTIPVEETTRSRSTGGGGGSLNPLGRVGAGGIVDGFNPYIISERVRTESGAGGIPDVGGCSPYMSWESRAVGWGGVRNNLGSTPSFFFTGKLLVSGPELRNQRTPLTNLFSHEGGRSIK